MVKKLTRMQNSVDFEHYRYIVGLNKKRKVRGSTGIMTEQTVIIYYSLSKIPLKLVKNHLVHNCLMDVSRVGVRFVNSVGYSPMPTEYLH